MNKIGGSKIFRERWAVKNTLVTLAILLLVMDPIVIAPGRAGGDGFLGPFITWEGYGGYVSGGIGTWGSESGIVSIQDIPSGAFIEMAFIYWMCTSSGLDPFIFVNGYPVTGVQIGVDGSWYSFRSDITAIVTGNGDYSITNITAFGASIVAIYSDSSSTYSVVQINDGQDTAWGESLPHWLNEVTYSGFVASQEPQAKITYILGDGQTFYVGQWRYDKYSFNGIVIAEDHADGSDSGGTTHGWDTDTYDVSDYVSQGDTMATANMYEENDELGWVASVFSVTIGPPPLKQGADAGPDQTVNEGDEVQFNGSLYTQTRHRIWPVDISGNGQYLAVGWDNNVSFFSTASNVPIWTNYTGGRVGDLKLSDNGQYLVVGSYTTFYFFNTTSSIPLWSVNTGRRYDGEPSNSLDMTRDGNYIASTAIGNKVQVFDSTSPTPTIPYWDYIFGDDVIAVRFSGDGRYLAMGGNHGHQFKLGWVPGKSINWTYSGSDPFCSSSVSYNGNRISAGQGIKHIVRLWGSGSSTPIWSATVMGRQFEQAMSDDGNYFASSNHDDGSGGTWSGYLLWNTSDSTPVWTYSTGTPARADALDMDRNANYVVGGNHDGNVYLFSQLSDGLPDWSSSDGTPIYTFQTGDQIRRNGASLSPDGTYFAIGSLDGCVYLFTTVGTPHLVWTWCANVKIAADPPPGSVNYSWDFNNYEDSDGDGNFTNDIDAVGQNQTHVFGDDGIYVVTMNATDDKNVSYIDTCVITVNNVAPAIQPFGPFTIEEGSILSINGIASDPGSDDLNFSWSWGDETPDNTSIYYNDGANPDLYPSPNGTFPFSKINSTNHTYVSFGIYILNLTVEDDDGGITIYSTNVTVISIAPPVLYINMSQDKEDVVLYWEHPFPLGVDYYLIYRSTPQIAFDFSTVWVNTSSDNETGEIDTLPTRTMWNDTFAALPEHDNYEEQYYYVIRMVNILGNVSRTSRTVGKWTKDFLEGTSTFSLPLEPVVPFYTDYYTSDMNAKYIKYMDYASHIWRQHNLGDGNTNNTLMKLGEGYEVNFASQTNYTFTGMPGAMISYDDASFGFDA
ncbi:MAG: PKD domain-containing protein, partial [Thermoplasmata archaeon]